MNRFHAVIVLASPTTECPSGIDVVDSTDASTKAKAVMFFTKRPFWTPKCEVWTQEECEQHPAGIFNPL